MFNFASTPVAAEHTNPCVKRIARRMPNVGPLPRAMLPSEPTFNAVVIICALSTKPTSNNREDQIKYRGGMLTM